MEGGTADSKAASRVLCCCMTLSFPGSVLFIDFAHAFMCVLDQEREKEHSLVIYFAHPWATSPNLNHLLSLH